MEPHHDYALRLHGMHINNYYLFDLCVGFPVCSFPLPLKSETSQAIAFVIYSLPAACPAKNNILNFVMHVTFMNGTNKFIRASILK